MSKSGGKVFLLPTLVAPITHLSPKDTGKEVFPRNPLPHIEGRAAGFNRRQVRDAGERLGVISSNSGFDGGRICSLPEVFLEIPHQESPLGRRFFCLDIQITRLQRLLKSVVTLDHGVDFRVLPQVCLKNGSSHITNY